MDWYKIVASILMIVVVAFLGYTVWKKYSKPQVTNPDISNPASGNQPPKKNPWPWGKIVGGAVALVVISVIGWYAFAAYRRTSTPVEVADTTKQDVVRPDHPVKVVMPRQYNAEITVDTDKVDQKIVWQGVNKVRIFTTKEGTEEVPITYRVFPCTTDLPCYSPTPTSQVNQTEEKE